MSHTINKAHLPQGLNVWYLVCRFNGFIGTYRTRIQRIPYWIDCPHCGRVHVYPYQHLTLNGHTPRYPHFIINSLNKSVPDLLEKVKAKCRNCAHFLGCKPSNSRANEKAVCWKFEFNGLGDTS